MKQPHKPLRRTLLEYFGVMLLLCVLGLAVLALTNTKPTTDEFCATSASHLC